MADNYLEKRYEAYEARKAAIANKKKMEAIKLHKYMAQKAELKKEELDVNMKTEKKQNT